MVPTDYRVASIEWRLHRPDLVESRVAFAANDLAINGEEVKGGGGTSKGRLLAARLIQAIIVSSSSTMVFHHSFIYQCFIISFIISVVVESEV